jgi:hypothetical protein
MPLTSAPSLPPGVGQPPTLRGTHYRSGLEPRRPSLYEREVGEVGGSLSLVTPRWAELSPATVPRRDVSESINPPIIFVSLTCTRITS